MIQPGPSPSYLPLCIRQLRLKWGRYIQTVGPRGYAHLGYREQGGKSEPMAVPPLLGHGQAHGCVGSTTEGPFPYPEATGRLGPITVKPLQVLPCTLPGIWLPPSQDTGKPPSFLA